MAAVSEQNRVLQSTSLRCAGANGAFLLEIDKKYCFRVLFIAPKYVGACISCVCFVREKLGPQKRLNLML